MVVFPAPFWPTNPEIDPVGISRSSPSTARRFPKRFVSPLRLHGVGTGPSPVSQCDLPGRECGRAHIKNETTNFTLPLRAVTGM